MGSASLAAAGLAAHPPYHMDPDDNTPLRLRVKLLT